MIDLTKNLWSRGRIEISKTVITGGYKFTVGHLAYTVLKVAAGKFTCPELGTFETLVAVREAIVKKIEGE